MNYKLLILLLIISVFTACNDDKKVEEQAFKEVMEIHDEVMPEMGTLRGLAKSLRTKIDSLESDSTEMILKKKDEMKKLAESLDEANESMMDWMRQFEQLEEGTPHGEVMNYLKEQREAVGKVRDQMLTAKKQGEYYLENN